MEDKVPYFGVRHLQVIYLFCLLTVAIGMRVHLSVSIVAMTTHSSSNPEIPVYSWNNQNIVLSSFFWGYITLQLFAADWGRRYGSKPFLLGAMTINSTAFALTPLLAAKFGSYGVMGSRTLQGVCQGFIYPSVSNLLGRWTHISERSRLGSFTLAGASFGTILCIPVVGFISASRLGWPFSFYLYAGLGYWWVILFAIFGASSPAQCRHVSKAERAYIESSSNTDGGEKKKIPVNDILTSKPFWALILAQVGQIWGYNTLLTEIPSYMDKMMKFDIKSNGYLSAAPYATCFLLSFFFGYLCDYFINNKYLSRTAARKIFNGISGIGAGLSLVVLGFLPTGAKTLTVLMLMSAVGIQSAANGGYLINHIDLSPNFAGLLQAIGNTCGSTLSILAPITVQMIVVDTSNKSQWQMIFIIASIMYIVPSILFALFASGDRQKWDGSDDQESVERVASEVRVKKVSVWSIMST